MNDNNAYQSLPTGPIVAQAVVIPPRSDGWSSTDYKITICCIVTILTVIGTVILISGGMEYGKSGRPLPSVPIIVFGFIVVFGASCLWEQKGCRSSSGQVLGPVQDATQTVGVPVVGQVVSYPTTPAASSVPGGLVSTYTYTPLNQPSPGEAPAPTYNYSAGGQSPNYPSPGQVSAPAYPYAGGQAPGYPMDQKPPIGAPVGTPVGAPIKASAPGFQAPPTAASPYLPEYQAPPPFAPGESPPPYSDESVL